MHVRSDKGSIVYRCREYCHYTIMIVNVCEWVSVCESVCACRKVSKLHPRNNSVQGKHHTIVMAFITILHTVVVVIVDNVELWTDKAPYTPTPPHAHTARRHRAASRLEHTLNTWKIRLTSPRNSSSTTIPLSWQRETIPLL